MGVFLALLAAMAFGGTAVLVRVSTRHLNTTTVAVVSSLAGMALVLPIGLGFQWPSVVHLSGATTVWLVVIGILQFVLGRQLNFIGVQQAGVNRATPFFGTVPVFAAIFAVAFGHEQMGPLLGLGIAAVVVGSALVGSGSAGARRTVAARSVGAWGAPSLPPPLGSEALRHNVLLGSAAALAASVCYGSGQFLSRQVVEDVSPLAASTVSLAAGALVLLFAGMPFLRRNGPAPAVSYAFAAGAGITSALGVLLMFLALDRGAVVKISPVLALNPLVSVVLGQLFIRRMEHLTARLALGIGIVLAGVAVVALSRGG